jgi:hypothetical protein
LQELFEKRKLVLCKVFCSFLSRKEPKELEWVVLKGTPQESFDQTFWAVCREPTAKRRSLVATSETLFSAFLFS